MLSLPGRRCPAEPSHLVGAVPLDPIVSLAVALAEAPGTCACVFGAGVSDRRGRADCLGDQAGRTPPPVPAGHGRGGAAE